MTPDPLPTRSVLRYLFQDLRTDVRGLTLKDVGTVRFLATFLFRLSSLVGARWGTAGSAIKQINHLVTGADLAWQAKVGPGLVLFHPTGVVWGEGAVIGANVSFQQGVTIGKIGIAERADAECYPVVEDDVRIGAGAKIIGHLVVGRGSIIGANAVVLHSVSAGSVAVGVPAVVKSRAPDG